MLARLRSLREVFGGLRGILARPAIEWKEGKGEESEEERVWKWGENVDDDRILSPLGMGS